MAAIVRKVSTASGTVAAVHATNARQTFVAPIVRGAGTSDQYSGNVPAIQSRSPRQSRFTSANTQRIVK